VCEDFKYIWLGDFIVILESQSYLKPCMSRPCILNLYVIGWFENRKYSYLQVFADKMLGKYV